VYKVFTFSIKTQANETIHSLKGMGGQTFLKLILELLLVVNDMKKMEGFENFLIRSKGVLFQTEISCDAQHT
jgi:hypothetical protein